jgi:basic amino acid/polyamine antiporter, APA family
VKALARNAGGLHSNNSWLEFDAAETVFSTLAVGAVLVLRRNEPDLPRPYRTPLYPFVPVFFIVMSMVIIWNAVSERPLEAGLGLATVLAGTPLCFL